MMSQPSDRVRLRRAPERGSYDLESALDLADRIGVATVAYGSSGGPRLVPTFLWRQDDALYWHGSSAGRAIRDLSTGVDCTVNAWVVDGLVLARSGMHSSVNYRSVTCYGTARPVEEAEAKFDSLRAFVDRYFPGRWEELRPPTEQELKATTVMRMAVEEASTKINKGMPNDPVEDRDWPIWAGVMPVETGFGEPIDAPDLEPGVARPAYLGNTRILRDS